MIIEVKDADTWRITLINMALVEKVMEASEEQKRHGLNAVICLSSGDQVRVMNSIYNIKAQLVAPKEQA